MSMSKERLIFDTTAPNDSDNVGAFIRTTSGIVTSQLLEGRQALHTHATTARPEDSPHASGSMGEFVLAVRNDAGSPLAANGEYIPFTTDATGALRVAATVQSTASGVYNEDSPHISGQAGSFVLAVRQNTLASSTDTDGDFNAFKTNAAGALYVDVQASPTADAATDAGNPVKVGSRAESAALTAIADGQRADLLSDTFRRVFVNTAPNIAVQQTQRTISGVLAALPATNLTGRTRIIIQNASNGAANTLFIGGAGTTTANGTRLSAGSVVTLDLGDDVTLSGISAGTSDVRILELA